LYGIGDTIWDAFEDYKKRHYRYWIMRISN
jgi:hypothetical protein